MLINMLYSKIHRAKVTECELGYNGSMGIDKDIMEQAGLVQGQQIDVLNVNNGERFTTYVIEAPRGSKTFGIYGAAARLAQTGDIVIIIAYAAMTQEEANDYTPRLVFME
ncbi:MAG: aspartate 1-decarboxylase [Pseudomonadota bacterium]